MRWDAEKYDKAHAQQADAGRELIAMADIRDGNAVLDIGCGTGTLTADLARLARKGRVVAIDPSREMLAMAREKNMDAGNVTLMNIPAEEMKFCAEFDIVYSNSALQWIRDQERVMALAFSSLKNSGRLAVQLPAKDFCWELSDNIHSASAAVGMQSVFSEMGPPWRFPLKEEFAGILRDAGFSGVNTFYREYRLMFESINKVLEWGASAALRPYLALMDEKKGERFKYAFAMGFENYRTEKGVEFSFRRLFALAEKR